MNGIALATTLSTTSRARSSPRPASTIPSISARTLGGAAISGSGPANAAAPASKGAAAILVLQEKNAPPALLGGPTRFWLGRVEGVPVATALSYAGHGVVNVEAVATLPEWEPPRTRFGAKRSF